MQNTDVFQLSDNRIASADDKGNPRNAKAFKRVISPQAIGRSFVLSTLIQIQQINMHSRR